MTVFGHRDLISGVILVAASIGAVLVLLNSAGLRMGATGPVAFPLLISGLLALSGAAIAARSFFVPRPESQRLRLWPLAVISSATLLFGLFFRQLGMLPSVILIVLILGFANRTFRIAETFVLALGLAAFCYVMFLLFLDLPVPAFGTLFRL